MGITVRRAHAGKALAALLALSAIAAGVTAESGRAARGIAAFTSELRIEGPKGNILPGAWYVTGDESIRRSRGLKCRHTDGREEVTGANALGIAETASRQDPSLPPVRVREDDFGLFVCELGGLIGRPFDHPDGFSGWTYWVDFAGGTQAAENEVLGGDDRVLWAFSDFGDANLNTGNALELGEVPAYDADGTFEVQVLSHTFGGTPSGSRRGEDQGRRVGNGPGRRGLRGDGRQRLHDAVREAQARHRVEPAHGLRQGEPGELPGRARPRDLRERRRRAHSRDRRAGTRSAWALAMTSPIWPMAAATR